MTTLKLFTVMASAMVMSACSQAADSSAESPADATNAGGAEISEDCKNHPLLAAMPQFVEIAGKKPLSMDCNTYSIDMFWGEDGDSTWIQLVDGQASIEDGSLAAAEQMARDMSVQAATTNLTTATEVRKTGLAQPDILAMFGGPDFLPVVETGPAGLEYTISIDRQSDGGAAKDLLGLLNGRYAVKINMDDTKAVGATAGQAAYAPWLSALRLSALQ